MAQPGSWDPAAPLPYGVAALLSTTLGCAMPDCRTTQWAADQDLALAAQQQRSSSPLMRRVASAPALKVSSSSSSSSSADDTTQPSSRGAGSAAAAATTSYSPDGEAGRCLEVYVVSRAFSEFGGAVFNRLTPEMRRYMVDIGICHYMTVFRTPDGQLVQFDFGPQGGDVQKARGPLAALLRTARRQAAAAAAAGSDVEQGGCGGFNSSGRQAGGMVHSASLPALPVASLELSGAPAAADGMVGLLDGSRSAQPRGVVGEIRERHLEELPSAHLYVGRTQLSLSDIRSYNAAQRMQYELHMNDCRHYVNSLVHYATGVEASTQHLKRHHYRSRHAGRWIPHGWFVETSQVLTDVGNWGHVKAGTAATLLAMTGRATLAHLKALSLPLLPLLKSVPLFAWAPGAAITATAAAGGPSAAAALLMKRPLATGGVAAASGAAAASGLGRGRQGEGGGQLGHGWGERLGSSIRAAAMALRRPGHGRPSTQQRQAVEAAPSAAAARAVRRGWLLPWARRNQQQQQPPQVVLAAAGCVVGATPSVFLASDSGGELTPGAGTHGSSSSNNSRSQRWRHNPFDWGSHVLWLGGHALRATSGLVAAASRRVGLRQSQQSVPLTAAGFGAPGGLSGGSSSSAGHHSPGRAVMAMATGRGEGLCFDPVWGAVGLQGGSPVAGAGHGSSSLRGVGGTRQTLHLPMPRLTWFAKNKRNMVA